jgi:hypothetical protein
MIGYHRFEWLITNHFIITSWEMRINNKWIIDRYVATSTSLSQFLSQSRLWTHANSVVALDSYCCHWNINQPKSYRNIDVRVIFIYSLMGIGCSARAMNKLENKNNILIECKHSIHFLMNAVFYKHGSCCYCCQIFCWCAFSFQMLYNWQNDSVMW